ncbi:MAG: Gfo/Idh/MocA family oxidoreductase, partial [Oscillibacter sp.]|nr:Gfo/Idh/MocA family oxidoreductase [Oscillibacter sp.]
IAMIHFLLKYGDAELVAVCDKYRPALDKVREAADEAGIKVALFEDFDRFLECDMDAVVLANYATEHAPFAVRCLKSGRHVLSEVMAAQTLAQAVELVEAVEQTGKVYAYAENFCYFRGGFEMRLRYDRGEIGEFTYGEGEYVHDCTARWPSLTYGDPNHWRNNYYVNYYCSHSLGPVLFITGQRPKRIVGFENQPSESMRGLGARLSAGGMILCQTENGGMIKALHGHLKREPVSYWCSVYGTKGCMEPDRWGKDRAMQLNSYVEGPQPCKGDYVHYEPKRYVDSELSRETTTHFGADFYTGYFFLEKLLGREDGKYSIDIYRGLDMSLPGIFAHRSILAGNQPMDFPDFRDPKQREPFRHDNACVDPKIAGEAVVPSSSFTSEPIPPEVYERAKKLWEAGLPG